MIFDAHVHTSDNEGRRCEDILAVMEANQIDRAVLLPGTDPKVVGVATLVPSNAYVADAKNRYPEKFEAFAWVNPHAGDQAVEEARRCIREEGFRGIKLHLTAHACSFERHWHLLAPLMELAAEEDVPALFHTGDFPYSLPQSFEMPAWAFPKTKFVLAHMGATYLWHDYLVKLGERYPNIYLETSQYCHRPVIQEALDRLGSERVIYGSDTWAISPEAEIAKLMTLRMSDADRENVFAKNIMRLMNLI